MAVAIRPQNNFLVLPHTPKETTYGTAVADGAITNLYALSEPSLAETVKERVYDDDQIKGHEFAADTGQHTELFRDATLPVTFPASAEIAGLIYSNALGTLITSGAGPFVHTVTAQGLTTDQLPSISFVNGTRGQTATYKKYKGCIPNEVRFACENRGRCTLSTTFFTDGSETDASAFSLPASLATATPLFGKNATFKMADAGSGLVDYSNLLRSFEVTWNNNLSREDGHGQITDGLYLKRLAFGARTISIMIKLWGSKGDTFYSTDFLNDVVKDIELKVVSGTSSIVFNFDRCVIHQARDSFDDIRNVLELEIHPFTLTAAGISPIQVVVTNGITTYLA